MKDLTQDIENIIVNWLKSENENTTYCADQINSLIKRDRAKTINDLITESYKSLNAVMTDLNRGLCCPNCMGYRLINKDRKTDVESLGVKICEC
jgi:hypothetical protein